MNAGAYQEWMKRAFLNVESVLAEELCAHTSYVNEEYVRTALVKGLVMSRPGDATRVSIEQGAAWTGANCAAAPACVETAGGRPIQHDVAISPEAGHPNDGGLRCEVKWLKTARAVEVAADIWKLALSRGVSPEGTALRTYLLLGGDQDALGNTLDTLAESSLRLRYRDYGDRGPRPTPVNLADALNQGGTAAGSKSLHDLLAWGANPRRHCRVPPATRTKMRRMLGHLDDRDHQVAGGALGAGRVGPRS